MKTIEEQVWDQLRTVMDPELHVDIVSLGLIYQVTVEPISHDVVSTQPVPTESAQPAHTTKPGQTVQVFIVMTLTTPGCPLAGVFDQLVKSSLVGIPGIEPDRDVEIELTFDPPWVPDMMSEEARAELGFD